MTYMLKEIMEQPSVIKKCLSVNENKLDLLVEKLKAKKPDYIMIAARGTSDHAAVYAKYMFEALAGIPVALAAPSVITTYKSRLSLKNAFVIGISQSGEAQDVISVLKNAKDCGAVTASITNFADSPLAETSEFTLLCSAGTEKSVAATKTFTAQLILLGMLAAKYAGRQDICDTLNQVPGYVSDTIGMVKPVIGEIAERYRFIDECIVLARGMNYAVALESALKIEETTYVRAKAFAASDFHHGPMAILQNAIPVLAYAPTGPSFDDMKELFPTIKESGADLLIISDSEELKNVGNCFIQTPHAVSDFVSPFINAVAAQLFACSLAHVKSLNPDTPRMLHKVTVTV